MTKEQYVLSKGYYFNKYGAFFNPKGIEVGSENNHGYKKISIRIKGKYTIVFIHRIKAYEKFGSLLYEKGIVTRHLNGNKLDNTNQNIEIGTNKDNRNDIPKELIVKMAFHASSFIKKYDNDTVKDFYNKCNSYKETMSRFNISSKGTLHYILNNN